jgi:hypothetical protein
MSIISWIILDLILRSAPGAVFESAGFPKRSAIFDQPLPKHELMLVGPAAAQTARIAAAVRATASSLS